jgi:hypothetical protein
MIFSSKPAPPWRDTAPSPVPPGPPWRSPAPRVPYRMRWWKLAGVAVAGILTLATATWAVFWIRPPDPAHLLTLVATYDNTLAVAPNPYGKASARELAELTKPGGWLGTQTRVRGSTTPTRFTRIGLPDLSSIREKCIVIAIAAHGGRDRDGAFLFPEDATAEPEVRVRVKAIVDQLAKLPAQKQKLLILDATEQPAFTDLGLVHNDFASAVEELNDAIAAVPNLAVFMSSGADQRSWVSPEWGQSSFLHHVLNGLRGAADANGDKRISGGELVDYVGPRVQDWARDHRGALQTPVLLPKGDEGRLRVLTMHLAMTDEQPPPDAAPIPFNTPPELEQAWQEYRDVAAGYPSPTAYTPHLWRQYEAWILRFEQAVIAGDSNGAKNARSKASDVKRQIEAARQLDIDPQTLALPAGLGSLKVPVSVPEPFRLGIEQLAAAPAMERVAVWAKGSNIPDCDPKVSSLLWCRALIEWTAVDPLTRLPAVPSLVALIADGLPIRPAEINFLLMLSQNLPPTDKTELIGPLLKRVLHLRLEAENAAELTTNGKYPFPEWLGSYASGDLHSADAARRSAEDLCFATSPTHWEQASKDVDSAKRIYGTRITAARAIHDLIGPWHRSAAQLPGFTEWFARGSTAISLDHLSRELLFQAWRAIWTNAHEVAAAMPMLVAGPHPKELAAARTSSTYISSGMQLLNDLLAQQTADLLATKPEFDARPTARTAVVQWWHSASDVLTAPIPDGRISGPRGPQKAPAFDVLKAPTPNEVTPAKRAKLVLEFRRVSQQLLVTGKTRPEAMPNVTPEVTREQAFSAARRRGFLLLDRLRVLDVPFQDIQPPPGFPQQLAIPADKPETPQYRFNHFAFQSDARQSLAEASSSCGELLTAAIDSAKKTDDLTTAERWLRVVPAYAAASDAPLDSLRRKRVRSILGQQARRTFLDHWYGEGGTRYYRTAIEHLAADAQKLGISSPNDPFKPYLVAEPPFPAAATTPPRFVVTDEPNPELTVSFKCQPPPGVNGMPVFWANPLLKSDTRLPVSLASNAAVPTLVRPISRLTTPLPRFPVAESTTVQIVGFFRGRTMEKPVPVDIYRLPDQVAATSPGLTSTAIAVRADRYVRAKYGFGTGAVSIVLDCSGSLGPTNRKNPLDRGLYPKALKALDTLIRGLPPGTVLNVWVFGERMPEAKSPEGTIREVLKPVVLPDDAMDLKDIIDGVNKDVSSLTPWDLSPIVRAVLDAKDRIQNEPVPFKAVVLISDGVDTCYDGDHKNLKKRSVKDALRAEFPPSDVSLSIVALPVPKSEASYQADFKVVNELKPSGKFVSEENVGDLLTWLRNGLNPRVRFLLEPLNGQSTSADLTAGTEASDNWYRGRLEPGTYQFRVTGAKEFSHTVELKSGDRLLLDLMQTKNRGEIELKRHWYADTVAGEKSGKPNDPWRLTLLQNRSEAGGLRLFATIEDHPELVDPLSVSRIGDVWFDLRPVLPNPGPVAARWRAAPGYPAPSWSIDVNGWPAFPGSKGGASPMLEAWWNPGSLFLASGRWMAPPGMPIASLKGESATFGDTQVTLDAIGIEEQIVGGKQEPQKCLVVRLSHPPKNPVWVRPLGTTAAGSEIRVYRGANMVTCLFWGIDDAKVTGFDVVVLNNALRRAKELGNHAILDNLLTPTGTSPRPEPPVELR